MLSALVEKHGSCSKQPLKYVFVSSPTIRVRTCDAPGARFSHKKGGNAPTAGAGAEKADPQRHSK